MSVATRDRETTVANASGEWVIAHDARGPLVGKARVFTEYKPGMNAGEKSRSQMTCMVHVHGADGRAIVFASNPGTQIRLASLKDVERVLGAAITESNIRRTEARSRFRTSVLLWAGGALAAAVLAAVGSQPDQIVSAMNAAGTAGGSITDLWTPTTSLFMYLAAAVPVGAALLTLPILRGNGDKDAQAERVRDLELVKAERSETGA